MHKECQQRIAWLAQSVEHETLNLRVVGSIEPHVGRFDLNELF